MLALRFALFSLVCVKATLLREWTSVLRMMLVGLPLRPKAEAQQSVARTSVGTTFIVNRLDAKYELGLAARALLFVQLCRPAQNLAKVSNHTRLQRLALHQVAKIRFTRNGKGSVVRREGRSL
jgi:hypothetical protein